MIAHPTMETNIKNDDQLQRITDTFKCWNNHSYISQEKIGKDCTKSNESFTNKSIIASYHPSQRDKSIVPKLSLFFD